MPVVMGAGGSQPEGTFAEYIVVDRHEVLETPAHLDDVHAAAWPLGGLTAWRCVPLASSVPANLIWGTEQPQCTGRCAQVTTCW
jgi:NADPH:quinone reductase-like Zn-dependent oxidoreductase